MELRGFFKKEAQTSTPSCGIVEMSSCKSWLMSIHESRGLPNVCGTTSTWRRLCKPCMAGKSSCCWFVAAKWRKFPAMCRRKEDGFSSKHWKDFSLWAAWRVIQQLHFFWVDTQLNREYWNGLFWFMKMVSYFYNILQYYCTHLLILPRKLTWQWKNTIFDRRHIFNRLFFHCHVSFQGCTFTSSSFCWSFPEATSYAFLELRQNSPVIDLGVNFFTELLMWSSQRVRDGECWILSN